MSSRGWTVGSMIRELVAPLPLLVLSSSHHSPCAVLAPFACAVLVLLCSHLFDVNGAIKRYDTPMQVIDDYFPVRLAFYDKRRDRLMRDLINKYDARAGVAV